MIVGKMEIEKKEKRELEKEGGQQMPSRCWKIDVLHLFLYDTFLLPFSYYSAIGISSLTFFCHPLYVRINVSLDAAQMYCWYKRE